MLSKLILLLGSLIAGFIAFSCIQNNKDTLQTTSATPPIPQENALPAIPEDVELNETATIEKEEIVQPEILTLKAPSFLYEESNTTDITVSVNTNESAKIQKELESYCPAPKCKLTINTDDYISQASWGKDAVALVKTMQTSNVKNGYIHIFKDQIEVKGNLADEKSKNALENTLEAFKKEGMHIDTNLTIVKKPETKQPETSVNLEEVQKEQQLKKEVPVIPEKNGNEKSQSTTLEDVQKQHIQKVQQNINTILKNNPIYFKRNSNELTLSSKQILDKIIDIVNKTTEEIEIAKLKISGHTDASGSAAYNKKLSQKRADTVRDYLIEHHIKVPALEAVGYGEEMPVTQNPYDKQNRRVEIEIQQKESSHE